MTPKPRHPHQLVVVGTDTDVGKTVISALVVQGLSAHSVSYTHLRAHET